MKKIQSLKNLIGITDKARKAGKKIVATNGCFDVLHVGHIRNLKAAKKLGDMLIVGLNSDSSVKKNKGPSRPIITARERAELIAALEAVDYVFIYPDKTPFSWIKKLQPHVHVKGGGEDVKKHPDFLEQKSVVEKAGGKLLLVPHSKGYSTTDIIKKIQNKIK